jgi:hypothetical protein
MYPGKGCAVKLELEVFEPGSLRMFLSLFFCPPVILK